MLIETSPFFDTVMQQHKFVKNPDLADPEPGQKKARPRRRICSEPTCKAYMHFCCQHYKCQLRKYKVGKEEVFGWFFCKDHWSSHWSDVVND